MIELIGAILVGCALKIAWSTRRPKQSLKLPRGAKLEQELGCGYYSDRLRLQITDGEISTGNKLVPQNASAKNITRAYNELVKQYLALKACHGPRSEFQELSRPL